MGKTKKRFANDMEMLEFLKNKIVDKIVKKIDEGDINLKVSDLLKIVEIQKKISGDNNSEKKFWEIIEEIRQKELCADD